MFIYEFCFVEIGIRGGLLFSASYLEHGHEPGCCNGLFDSDIRALFGLSFDGTPSTFFDKHVA